MRALERSTVEAYAGIILGAAQWIASLWGIGLGFWFGGVLWLVVIALLADCVWRSPWTMAYRPLSKAGISIIIVVGVVVVSWKPARQEYRKEHVGSLPVVAVKIPVQNNPAAGNYTQSGQLVDKGEAGESAKRTKPNTTPTPQLRPPPPKPSEPSPSVAINSSDPYVGTPSSTVATWALEEADIVEALGRKCETDESIALQRQREHLPIDTTKGFYGPEGVQAVFWRNYSSQHQHAIAKLHDSLASRLGPVVTASEDAQYNDLLDSTKLAGSNPSQLGWLLCDEVQNYAKELRKMAAMANR